MSQAAMSRVVVVCLLAAVPFCLVQAQAQPQAQPQAQDQAQDQVQNSTQSQTRPQAQTQTRPQIDGQSQTPVGAYRGTFVCEKAPGSADILHVPADLAVRGDQVEFARPLFNPRGTRVLGSELAAGAIDASGRLHLTSTWYFGGITVHGDYSGTLAANGGTLTGTQSWRGLDGERHSRTCQAALVLAANATQGQQSDQDQNAAPDPDDED